MRITLSPMRRDNTLTLSKAGDTLTINGEAFDLSGVPEGATLPREAVECDWLAGPVERQGGVLHLTLILPHAARAPEATLFPQPIIANGDGPIALPPYEMEPENVED